MHTFTRNPKKQPNAYYFGEFDKEPKPPFSISIATLPLDYVSEKPHFHANNQKVYVTLRGAGVLNVDGKKIPMIPEQLIHVEPKEVHFVEHVIDGPLEFIVVLSSKTDDKVIIGESAD